jgi:phosphonate transport system substrate-binding protein
MINKLSKILSCVLLSGVAGAGYGAASELPAMGTAYSTGMFGDANLTDVKATTKVWVDSFGTEQNLCRSGEVQIIDSPAAWRAAAEKKSFALAVLNTIDYLEMEKDGFLLPRYVLKDSNGIGSELLLLVHRDSGAGSLADLAGKDILLTNDIYAEISRMWMETLLADKGLPAAEQFFGAVTKKPKASNTVLPVFFKKSAACVVTRGSFETMKELNPQLGTKLTVLDQSPNYLPTVACLLNMTDPELKAGLEEKLGTLHTSPYGKQLLMTFRVEKFTTYSPEQILSIRELVEKHTRLQNRNLPSRLVLQPAS